MNSSIFDLQSARTLFSEAQRIKFGFFNPGEIKKPYINLFFRPEMIKPAAVVLQQLSDVLNDEQLKLFINENGGDFLSVSFLWDSRSVIFSSSPDRYNKRECRDFRANILYGDTVKLILSIDDDGQTSIIKNTKNGIEADSIDTTYYKYLP
jgi:hypothetical protein